MRVLIERIGIAAVGRRRRLHVRPGSAVGTRLPILMKNWRFHTEKPLAWAGNGDFKAISARTVPTHLRRIARIGRKPKC
ncbi:MAG: hypothetical protein ACK5NE_06185 [Brachymonas sp.]